MPNLPHRIRRLRCMIATNSQTAAFAMRKSLHDRWQDTIIPAFESAFDEIANDDRVIHIPKLELHLKVTSEQELLEVLPELIRQQLTEQLSAINQQTIPPNQSELVWQTATAAQNQFDILLHYLQTGSLPWQSLDLSPSEIAIELKATCHQQRSQLVNYLSSQVATVAVYFRLLQLLSESEFVAFVNDLHDKFSPASRTAIVESIVFVLDRGKNHFNRDTQWQLVATILSECLNRSPESHGSPSAPAIEPDFRRIINSVGIDLDAIVPFMPAVAMSLFKPRSNLDRPFTSTGTRSASTPGLEGADEPFDRPTELSKIDTSMPVVEGGDERFDRLTELSNRRLNPVGKIDITAEEFPIGVNYAGLILIHPFIGTFFQATGITDTNNSIEPTQLPRAATLLHFLATGREEVYEYELGLIKILLGLSPETPLLVGSGSIEEQDRSEAEVVLQSILNYWTVLKSTSVDGLRSSFLQRSGLLRTTEQGWSLHVEHQSFDMLLEHLPWSISIIKLAWMKYPLYTEWQTF
ncbi:contractile injection system tape measure protein [Chamaesiphon sp. VAR_48_metabat_135_sub]|uniref:contractile injection system tape measure protein n=1 Tax=Chamaesiphon sp. VAR_48_metabat_135_sub TaxID=2964699 RepID=UPI00286B3CEB|nr:contractile injection system tape measure protein [Chamaesiphon sp. VAR_48_metabat_135_sub]